VFSALKRVLLIVCSTLSRKVFCLDFGPFFFLFFCSLPQCFSLFIYLKDAILGHDMKPLFEFVGQINHMFIYFYCKRGGLSQKASRLKSLDIILATSH